MGGMDWISEVINLGKRAYDLAKKANNLELEEAIMSLREAALESRQELLDAKSYAERLETQVKELERNRVILDTLKRSGSVYWATGDPAPFCSRCVEIERLGVHLIMTPEVRMGKRMWGCPKCNTSTNDCTPPDA